VPKPLLAWNVSLHAMWRQALRRHSRLSQASASLVEMPSPTEMNSKATGRWRLYWKVAGRHRGPTFGVFVLRGSSGA
jgi:hypothetical protein